MPFTDLTTTTDVANKWPYEFQDLTTGTDINDLLTAFANEYQYFDVIIDDLYENMFLETAVGHELEALAAELGVGRREGETDDTLRYRARLARVVAASNGNAKEIATVVQTTFPGKDISVIDVTHTTGAPVIQFAVPQTYIDDIPLTQTEVETELATAFPCGTNVTLVTSDTFLFGESGSQGLGNGELL